MSGLFVTGTDTGVGKTLVSCALLAALCRRGARMGAYKPVETGCARGPGGALEGEDGLRLVSAAGLGPPPADVSAARYALPAAPLVAAEAEGARIEPAALVKGYEALAGACDAVLVEGAGGLLVPVAPGFTFADLAVRLGLPVLVVVASRLGCLNHALLTLEALEQRGLRVLGVVWNHPAAAPAAEAGAIATHRATLARFSRAPDLGELPVLGAEERRAPEALAAWAEAALDVDAVARALGLAARP